MNQRDYAAARLERERQQWMTITDPAKYLAGLILEIDQSAIRVEHGQWCEYTLVELSRFRALALSALWRLPLGGEESTYPAGRVRTPGEVALSQHTQFHQAIRPWATADWRGVVQRDRALGEIHRTIKIPWSKGGGFRYAYTPEELGNRARRAASIVRRSGVLKVFKSRREGRSC